MVAKDFLLLWVHQLPILMLGMTNCMSFRNPAVKGLTLSLIHPLVLLIMIYGLEWIGGHIEELVMALSGVVMDCKYLTLL